MTPDFTLLAADDEIFDKGLGRGYEVSLTEDLESHKEFATKYYLVHRRRTPGTGLFQSGIPEYQRKFGILINHIPISIEGGGTDKEVHTCSIREEWFVYGDKVFTKPYRRELTIEISFKDEFLSFYDDRVLTIRSMEIFGSKYSYFHVDDPKEFCPGLKSGPFRAFPLYIQEIFRKLFTVMKDTRGDSLDVIDMVTELVYQERQEIKNTAEFSSPARKHVAIEDLRKLREELEPSSYRSGRFR